MTDLHSGYHFGVVGDGGDVRVQAYGTSMLTYADEAPTAFTCTFCTFHNTETLGRFCSMCGNARTPGDSRGTASASPNNRRKNEFDDGGGGPAYSLSPEQPSRPVARLSPNDPMSLPPPPPPPANPPDETPRGITPRSSRRQPTDSGRTPRNRRMKNNEGSMSTLQFVPETSASVGAQDLSHQQYQRYNESYDFRGDESFRRATPRTRRNKNLDGSFSLSNLLCDVPEAARQQREESYEQQPASPLNEKDFMMSFANWSVSDRGAWTCVACTFLNTNPLHLACEICGQKRPHGDDAAADCQKAMQDAFETSIRTGQHDFIKRQQDRIEEIEERVIVAERVDEIMEIQNQLMQDLDDLGNELPQPRRGRNEDEDRHRMEEHHPYYEQNIPADDYQRGRFDDLYPNEDRPEFIYVRNDGPDDEYHGARHSRDRDPRSVDYYDNRGGNDYYDNGGMHAYYDDAGRRDDSSYQRDRSGDGLHDPVGTSSAGARNARYHRKISIAQEWIGQLEDVRRQEREEQQLVEEALERRRRQLNITRMPSIRYRSGLGIPQGIKNPDEFQVRAQEQMLSQWKQQWDSRSVAIESIRQQQQAIFEKLNGDEPF